MLGDELSLPPAAFPLLSLRLRPSLAAFLRGRSSFHSSRSLLFKRANNADMTWVDAGAALDQNAKTLLESSVNTEFMLGKTYHRSRLSCSPSKRRI